MWRFPNWQRHDELERELKATKEALAKARADLRASNGIRQVLAERVLALESELKGVHWTLDRFFAGTKFWQAVQHFIGQHHSKGQDNDSISAQ